MTLKWIRLFSLAEARPVKRNSSAAIYSTLCCFLDDMLPPTPHVVDQDKPVSEPHSATSKNG